MKTNNIPLNVLIQGFVRSSQH